MTDYVVNKDNINYHLYLLENKYIYNIKNLEEFLPTKIFYYILRQIANFNHTDYEMAILTVDDHFNFTIDSIADLDKNHLVHLYAKDMLNNGLDRFIYDIKSNTLDVEMNISKDCQKQDDILIYSTTDLLEYIMSLNTNDRKIFLEYLDQTDILTFPFYINKSNLSFTVKPNIYDVLFIDDNKTFDYYDIENKYYNIYLKDKYYNEQLIESLYLLEKLTNKTISDYYFIENDLKNIINNNVDSNIIVYETKIIKKIISIIIDFVQSQINEINDKTSKYTAY